MKSELANLYDRESLEQMRHRLKLDPARIRAYRNDVCKRFRPDETVAGSHSFARQIQSRSVGLEERHDSQLDGATKLLMRTDRGKLVETVVLRISTGRTTLCVSCQVGCAAACAFCATGQMGLTSNLTASEILDQIIRAGQLLSAEDRSIRNIVFMGMGEPFHNEPVLFKSLAILTSPDYFAHPPSRILVSSVGVTDGMIRCAKRFPTIRQAISLHSVRQDVRELIIPLAKRFPLDTVRDCLKQLNALQPCPVMVEYLMLGGVNDSIEDATELAKWLAKLNVHVNLIPFNAIPFASHLQPSSEESIQAFSRRLKRAGSKVTIRYSLGNDIAAACGQLVRNESMKKSSAVAP